MTAETALVSCFVICFRTINHKHFSFLKFGKTRGIAVRVLEVKVLSNKFCTWKEKGCNETCLVSLKTSMVSYQLYHNRYRKLTYNDENKSLLTSQFLILFISSLVPPCSENIKIAGPTTVYEGDDIILTCQAGPSYPGN